MTQVGQWLERLGLGQYAQVFSKNEVDYEVLPDLTEGDLKDIGIPLGPRKKLLKAIAELSDHDTNTVTDDAVTAETGIVSGAHSLAWPQAERRQLTVMFCDLVDSTPLAETLDPEDLRLVIQAYRNACVGVVQQFDGFVARYMGDGLLIYFGYPHAHENDAERSVRTGLGIVDAVSRLAPRPNLSLSVRVGIATGPVIVGDLIGEGASEESTVLGQTPNLAARLQGFAKPNTVVMGASTQHLVEGLFDCDDLGPQQLKGISEPVQIFRVKGESGARSRFDATVDRGMSRLVGREEELSLLLKRWELAKEEEGQVVLLSGEPGVGKSRIVRGLRRRLADEPHSRILYYCSPFYQNSALYPVIDQMERGLRFQKGDDSTAKLDKLETELTNLGLAVADHAPYLASLLTLPTQERYPELTLDPEQLKTKTIETVLSMVGAVAQREPVLMIVEDLHWADPSTLELLGLLIDCLRTSRVMLIGAFRPEFEVPWSGHAHVTGLALNKLSRKDNMALVAHLTGGKTLPDDVLNQILAKSDGIPLFVEELTKTVLDADFLEDVGDRFVTAGPLRPLAIPSSLEDSLMARLDNQAPIKEVAQLAAMLGRSFSHELLAAVWPRDQATLEDGLSNLVAADLMYQRGLPPEASYEFKHALVQDAAYQLLLKSTRQQYHGRIAEALEQLFPDMEKRRPEIFAHHWTEAHQPRKAVDYWLKAGRRATERYANLEAIAHFQKGIEVVGELPEGPERDRQELGLQFALGPCLIAHDGPASSAAVATFGRARELCDNIGDPPEYLQVMFWLATAGVVRGELPQVKDATKTLIRIAEARCDRAALLNARRGHAMSLLFMGEVVEARAMAERAVDAFNASAESDRLAALAAGQDAGVAGLALMSWALWLLGHVHAAVEKINEAVRRADMIEHPHSQAYVCYYASVLHALRGEPMIAQGFAERCLSLSEEHDFGHWRDLSRAMRGICLAVEDPSAELFSEVKEALQAYCDAGYQLGVTVLDALLARALLRAGKAQEALAVIEKGLSTAEQNSERMFVSELYRQKARALRLRAAPDVACSAQSLLEQALQTAGSQGVRSLELGAARDLAELWTEQGRRDEALSLLARIDALPGFTEGVARHDVNAHELNETKAMLDQLH